MPGPGYFIQAAIHPTAILFRCGPTFKELARQPGTKKRQRDRLCFQDLSLYPLWKGATEGVWAGGDLLRAVEWAQDDWRGETQGKDQYLTAGRCITSGVSETEFPQG